jgi:peptide/nickel transport system substrate-binding protein
MKARVLGFIMVVAIVTVVLPGCSPQEKAGPTTAPTTALTAPTTAPTAAPTTAPTAARTRLIIASAWEPKTLDAHMASWSDFNHRIISQPLVGFDMQLQNLVPDLAESWEVSADGKVITFHLPKGYKYSNGDPLDAQAVVDTWWRNKTIGVYKEDLDAMIEADVIDDTTFKVIHSDPPAFQWPVLVSEYGAVWDVAEAERIGDEQFGRKPVASGPFKLVEWVEGSHILYERNDNYQTNLPYLKNQGPPYLEEVLVRFIPEGLTRVSELEAGSVDIIMDVPSSEVARLEEDSKLQILSAAKPGLSYISINHLNPRFQDVRVRGAIASAINREDVVKALAGTVDPQYAFIPPAQLCYNEEMQQYAKELHPYDVETAKALLAEAGWTDTDGDGVVDKDGEPFTVVLLVPTDDPPRTKVGVVLQAQLQAIGLDVSIEEYLSDYIRDICAEGDYDLAFNSFSWSDPDILIYHFTDVGRNYPHYPNPEIKEKLMEGRYIMDMAERTAHYTEIQKTMIDDVAVVPVFTRKMFVAVGTWVKDLVFHEKDYGTIILNDVTIEE